MAAQVSYRIEPRDHAVAPCLEDAARLRDEGLRPDQRLERRPLRLRTPCGRRIGTDIDFVDALLEHEGVGLVAGVSFHLSPYVRLSCAAADDLLDEACMRIARFCESLR